MAAGMPAGQAVQIGLERATGLVAQGTTKAGALVLVAQANVFATVSSSKGAVLPPCSGSPDVAIFNNGSNALSVYSAGNDVINANSAGAAFSVTNGKGCVFKAASGGQWIAVLSA